MSVLIMTEKKLEKLRLTGDPRDGQCQGRL